MKKIILSLAIMLNVLFLSGCGEDTSENNTLTTIQTQTESELSGKVIIYDTSEIIDWKVDQEETYLGYNKRIYSFKYIEETNSYKQLDMTETSTVGSWSIQSNGDLVFNLDCGQIIKYKYNKAENTLAMYEVDGEIIDEQHFVNIWNIIDASNLLLEAVPEIAKKIEAESSIETTLPESISDFSNSLVAGQWKIYNNENSSEATITFNSDSTIDENSGAITGFSDNDTWSVSNGNLITNYTFYGSTISEITYTIISVENDNCYNINGTQFNSDWTANYKMCKE